MKKKFMAAMLMSSLCVATLGTSFVYGAKEGQSDVKGEVYAFIAASLGNAMKEVQENFNKIYPEVEILYNTDSSGTLQVQIEEGARCDLFFSAAQKQMDALVEKKLAKEDTVTDLLENKVVLIKPEGGETRVTGFENITEAESLALAGESVPAGQYAREIFRNLGILEEVEGMEINEGKNVTEVLAAVSEGSNEVGVVYATDAASLAGTVEIIAQAPEESLETPVLYPVGLIENKEASEEDQQAAELFLEYLQSADALKVFEKFGFTANLVEIPEIITEKLPEEIIAEEAAAEEEDVPEA